MLISEIGIKNFRSFGNNKQTLKLKTDTGELILLIGKNGAGKSSLLSAFEYVKFNKVKGMKKKWATLSELPNRINNEMEVDIKFVSESTSVKIIRGQNPSKLELYENDILFNRAGKANIDEQIQKYIGLDIDTYKGFVSMSVNDFKNFINLSSEDKRVLLDKLFNLQIIDTLNEILKTIARSTKDLLLKYDSELLTLEDSIKSVQKSIEKTEKLIKENKSNEIDTLKQLIESKKSYFLELKEKIKKIESKEKELSDAVESLRNEYTTYTSQINETTKQIDLYNSGKCPTCATDLKTDFYDSLKNDLIVKKDKLAELRLTTETNIKDIKAKQVKLNEIKATTNKAFNDLTYEIKGYKTKIETLAKDESNEVKDNVKEFLEAIEKMKSKKEKGEKKQAQLKDKLEYQKQLSKVFGEDGVKKSIISNIIEPINHFIKENLKCMHVPFEVELDDTFTAVIKHFSTEIDTDTLSTGETKKINIAIMMAYLKMIRTKKHINILFLDEVFSSIDTESIYDILELMRDFANSYNVNVFLVHHSILSEEFFDRIIKVNKDVFTTLEELK